jgi:hypothetical protein
MPNVFIIMGDRNTRKSATIRALAGPFQKGIYQVATHIGNIDIFVQISSLQESRISPQNFISEISQDNYQNVLVSLWVSNGNGQPNGYTYIQDFVHAGWNIQEIVVLGVNNFPNNLPENTPNPRFIPNSQNLPANQIASQIREWWQWL